MIGTTGFVDRLEENLKVFLPKKEEVARVGLTLLADTVEVGTKAARLVSRAGSDLAARNIENYGFPRVAFAETDDSNTDRKSEDYHLTLQENGVERRYLLHVPPGFKNDPTRPTPLVVVLHGWGQNGERIKDISKMSEKADKEHFIVAYPDANRNYGRADFAAWDTGNGLTEPGSNYNDVRFIRDLIDTTRKNLAIDPKRIYAAGFSNGGMLTYRLAAEMSDVFAAVADVSGAASGREGRPSDQVSVLAIHGDNDSVVSIDGLNPGGFLRGIGVPHFTPMAKTLADWKQNDGIIEPTRVIQRAGLLGITATDPHTGAEVSAFIVPGGHHVWPGSDEARSAHPDSFEARFPATDVIWDFFQTHPKLQDKKDPRVAQPDIVAGGATTA